MPMLPQQPRSQRLCRRHALLDSLRDRHRCGCFGAIHNRRLLDDLPCLAAVCLRLFDGGLRGGGFLRLCVTERVGLRRGLLCDRDNAEKEKGDDYLFHCCMSLHKPPTFDRAFILWLQLLAIVLMLIGVALALKG